MKKLFYGISLFVIMLTGLSEHAKAEANLHGPHRGYQGYYAPRGYLSPYMPGGYNSYPTGRNYYRGSYGYGNQWGYGHGGRWGRNHGREGGEGHYGYAWGGHKHHHH